MSERTDFVVEIGTEELPPRTLRRLAAAFETGILTGLRNALLEPDSSTFYCSPRRLAVKLTGLPTHQADQVQERLGPAVSAAYTDDGTPTRAALGFAASCGVDIEQLERRPGNKGERLVFSRHVAGKPAAEVLPEIICTSLAQLPISRRMRWGDGEIEFVRPVHWIAMLLGENVVKCTVLGIHAGRLTMGHRFHHPGPIDLTTASDYPDFLERFGKVRVNDAQNSLSRWIAEQATETAAQIKGAPVGAAQGDPLPEEIAALCEWPVALLGDFDTEFLKMPEEVIIAVLQGQQRYFPVRGASGRLQPHFIAFSNIESSDPEEIRLGNQRVVTPRLADALFFWDTDRAQRLESRITELDRVTFQQSLGSLGDKTRRVRELAEKIAGILGADEAITMRAAELAKCDLLTGMVGEFPELQGVMGHYYALHDNEPAEVGIAIEEQYLPRFANDGLPKTPAGQVLAVAEKLDTICGIFALGQRPSGDKDPFALRRAALGLLRIIIGCQLDLDLNALIRTSLGQQPSNAESADRSITEIFIFMMERLRAYFEPSVPTDVFNAVLARRPHRPLDFARRLKAVALFRELPEAASLAAANKRIGNILRQAKQGILKEGTDESLLEVPAEQQLWQEINRLEALVTPLFKQHDYEQALKQLAALGKPIDTFFDDVMVMTEDLQLRHNRLSLLRRVSQLFSHVADISELQIE